MRKIVYAFGFVPMLFGASSALADDFTGPRVEVRAGWDNADAGDRDPKADGVAYGIAAGYDFALTNNVIAGAEVGVDLFDNDTRQVSGNTTTDASAERDIEIAARLGYKFGDNVLVYTKAGYSNARFEEVLTVGGTTGSTRTEISDELNGIRVGGGFEVAISNGLFAKTEYRYTNYEKDVTRHQVMAAVGYRF